MLLLTGIRRQGRAGSAAIPTPRTASCPEEPRHQTVGALATDLGHAVVQSAMKVGGHDDPMERAAERFADETRCNPASQDAAGRVPGPVVQHRAESAAASPDTVAAPALGLGLGRPLDRAQRSYFEPIAGVDLAGVRIHTDEPAARAAGSIGARALTIGRDIAFAANEFSPGTDSGKRLLAHEIAHVVQQRSGDGGVVRRQPYADNKTRKAGPVDWKPGMRATLVTDYVGWNIKVKAGTPVEVVANPGFGVIQVQPVDPKARTKEPLQIDDIRLEPVGPIVGAPVALAQSYVPPDDLTHRSIAPSYARALTNAELSRQIAIARDLLVGTPGDIGLTDNLAVLEDVARERSLLGGIGSPGPIRAVPVDINYEMYDTETGWGAAGGRSTAIGAARGLGFWLSPPVRGPFDPLLPLASRLKVPPGELGVTGDIATLERYLTSPAGELTPRYASEAAELFMRQSHGESWWLNNFGITERQLSDMRTLVARMSEGGVEALAPAEQQLLMQFLRAHAQSVSGEGAKIATPALSTTAREGLSAVPEAAPFFREAPYVVRIQVPANAVVDVNAVMGAERMPTLVYEAEMLVFTDARGSITSVRPNPVSTLGRAAPVMRWVGRGFLLIGIGISAYRIATATPQELPRVVGEEAGGWLGGFGGSALGAGACIAFGIATEGFGLLLCGVAGGIGGGLAGSYLGGEAGEALGGTRGVSMPEVMTRVLSTPTQWQDYQKGKELGIVPF
jgi:hypothetical protein